MSKPLRVGVYGGAFDPPHFAHINLAQTAIEQLHLDVLHIVPTGRAWHKTRVLSPVAQRLAMARLAFEKLPRTLVDEQESEREGPSYTADTLDALHARYVGAQLFLLLGLDQARALHTWQRADDVPRLATICVADRAVESQASGSLYAQTALPDRTLTIALPRMPHSSTDIRARVAGGLDVSHLVPEAIARYIATHHLYQNPA